MNEAKLAQQLAALESAMAEVAKAPLGFEGLTRMEDAPVTSRIGTAYLALVGEGSSIQIGLGSDEHGCQALAKALLGMPSDDEDLPPEDVADAMCEVVNVLAGIMKRRMMPGVTLGLPLFVRGVIQPTERIVLRERALRIGPIPAVLVLAAGDPDVHEAVTVS